MLFACEISYKVRSWVNFLRITPYCFVRFQITPVWGYHTKEILSCRMWWREWAHILFDSREFCLELLTMLALQPCYCSTNWKSAAFSCSRVCWRQSRGETKQSLPLSWACNKSNETYLSSLASENHHVQGTQNRRHPQLWQCSKATSTATCTFPDFPRPQFSSAFWVNPTRVPFVICKRGHLEEHLKLPGSLFRSHPTAYNSQQTSLLHCSWIGFLTGRSGANLHWLDS